MDHFLKTPGLRLPVTCRDSDSMVVKFACLACEERNGTPYFFTSFRVARADYSGSGCQNRAQAASDSPGLGLHGCEISMPCELNRTPYFFTSFRVARADYSPGSSPLCNMSPSLRGIASTVHSCPPAMTRRQVVLMQQARAVARDWPG